MTTLRAAFDTPFPSGKAWATEALARLGMRPDDETPVRQVAQGWMRLGGGRDALLVDTLFVLTDERLGFGQTHLHTSDPKWVSLSTVVALDLIEGVPYPLEAIEVQFAGGLAIFVGWPEEFSQAVVDTLARQGAAPAADDVADPDAVVVEPEDVVESEEVVEPDLAVDDDVVGRDEAVPEAPGWDDTGTPDADVLEGEVVEDDHDAAVDQHALPGHRTAAGSAPFAAGGGIPERPVMPPLFAALDRPRTDDLDVGSVDAVPSDPDDRPDDAPGDASADIPLDEAPSFFADHPSSEAEDRFFADLEEREAADALFSVSAPEDDDDVPEVPEPTESTRGPWDDPAMPWPDPIRNCVFLGGHPVHQRRRKNVVLVMRAGGLVIANAGSGGWSVHVPWHEVRRIDVQGADEVKFTHNHRIDLNGSALVVELVDSTSLLVEIRSRRPATVRSTLAPVIQMTNTSQPAHPGGSDVTSF
jgi:hypothetical protein